MVWAWPKATPPKLIAPARRGAAPLDRAHARRERRPRRGRRGESGNREAERRQTSQSDGCTTRKLRRRSIARDSKRAEPDARPASAGRPGRRNRAFERAARAGAAQAQERVKRGGGGEGEEGKGGEEDGGGEIEPDTEPRSRLLCCSLRPLCFVPFCSRHPATTCMRKRRCIVSHSLLLRSLRSRVVRAPCFTRPGAAPTGGARNENRGLGRSGGGCGGRERNVRSSPVCLSSAERAVQGRCGAPRAAADDEEVGAGEEGERGRWGERERRSGGKGGESWKGVVGWRETWGTRGRRNVTRRKGA